MRTRPDNGWRYCRVCKREKDRVSRRKRMLDPDRRARVNAAQRSRRRNPATRESVLQYDRAKHAKNRASRIARYREYDAERKADGRLYAKSWGVSLGEAQYAVAHKPDACESCGRTEVTLYFDHDHAEKRFRGWLCHQCNVGIGLLGDTLEGVRNAVAYLERYHARTSQKI